MKSYFGKIITIALFTACSSCDSNSTLDSDGYESKAERVETLTREINPFSDLEDAEFELFNVNGFQDQQTSFPPGASSGIINLL